MFVAKLIICGIWLTLLCQALFFGYVPGYWMIAFMFFCLAASQLIGAIDNFVRHLNGQ